MRVLVTSLPQYGHFFPLVPLAWALRTAGHELRVAVPEQFTTAVAASGLPPIGVGGVIRTRDIMGAGDRRLLSQWAADATGMQIGAVRTVTRFAERMIEPMVKLCRDWHPELVVHPALEFAGPLAAAVLSIPAVSVGPGIALPAPALSAADDEIAPLCRRWGQPAGIPEPALRLSLWPPSLQASHAPRSSTIRHVPYTGSGVVPAWVDALADMPRTCVTLGSIVPKTGGAGVLVPVLGALSDLGHDVVLVLPGDDESVAALQRLGPLPGKVTVAATPGGPWLPLSYAVRACDIVVHHGGAGTTLTCLAYGLPQLVLPHMADQFMIADQLTRYGAARAVRPASATRESVAGDVAALLGRASYREKARLLRDEIERQPTPADVAASLADLARG